MGTLDRMRKRLGPTQEADTHIASVPLALELPASTGRDQVRWIRRMSFVLGLIEGSVDQRELRPELRDWLRDEMVRIMREECARMHEPVAPTSSEDDEPLWLRYFRTNAE